MKTPSRKEDNNKALYINTLMFLILIICLPRLAMSQKYQLVWSDEFNYTGLPDATKWDYDIGGDGWGNNELQYYTNRSENARGENGNLVIELRKEAYSGSSYTSARLVSRQKGDWKYGKIEVRAKLPSGKGTWPAIWMLPTDWAYGGWPASGEIDIMEHVGYDTQTIFGTVHTNDYNHTLGTQKGSQLTVADCETNFHKYGIIWNADTIQFYVDDNIYYTFRNEGTWQKWPFDQRFHLLLNIAFGGDWGGAQGIDESISSAKMLVDYVHVYQNIDSINIKGQDYLLPNENSTYSVNNIPGASYKWTLPTDVSIVAGNNTNEITVQWGNQEDSLKVEILTASDTFKVAKLIKLVTIPDSNPFRIVDLGDKNTNNIIPAEQTGNNFILTESDSTLRIDYAIQQSDLNPYLLFYFKRPVNMSDLHSLWLNLKTHNASNSVITRYDLMDVNGNITDKSPVFKIENPQSDGQFHEYGFDFSENWISANNAVVDKQKIMAIKMYIDYGFFGKDNVNDSLWIKDIQISDKKVSAIRTYTFKNLKVYPNPVQNELYIANKELYIDGQATEYTIYDINGSVLWQISSKLNLSKINISNLNKGIYFIKITKKGNIYRTKFIKK